MKKILLTYYTKTNTTKEYVEYIKENLETKDVKVEMLSIEEVNELDEYDLVVIGAPINGMMWKEEAINFVSEHKEKLSQLPTFYFFVSYIYENGRKMWKKAIQNSINKVSKIAKPTYYEVFGGRVEKKFPRFFGFLFGIKKELSADLVSFEKVDEFINKIKEEL